MVSKCRKTVTRTKKRIHENGEVEILDKQVSDDKVQESIEGFRIVAEF